MEASSDMENYFEDLSKKTSIVYSVAKNVRMRGLDPVDEVEVPLAQNMAERVEGLVSIVAPQISGKGIANRIMELEKKFGKLNWRVAFSIALDVAEEKFCKFKDRKEAIEMGIRVGFAYVTSGVVSSPLEGFLGIEIKKTRSGEDYFSIIYSGPVRSAGGTAAAVSVLIADFLRMRFGFSKYDPSEEEVRRAVTELYDYHERVTNLQYLPSEEEIDFFARNIPVQIDGPPTEEREVSNYKDLSRIETNRIRNGFCLVLGECLIQKAPKYWKQISTWSDEFEMKDWSFLGRFVKLQKKAKAKGAKEKDGSEIKPDYTFIKDIVAGRPVLTYPMEKGGFRLRYGRSRISGLSSLSIHPATMYILNGYIGTGTQLRYERPGKSTAVAPCDTIEGPIVKLKNGSVRFLDTSDEAKKHKDDIQEILFLGDILVNYGEFFNRAHLLVPPGYCLPYDESIFIFKDGLWQNLKIGDLIESLDKTSFREYNSMRWCDCKENIKVVSLNPENYEVKSVDIKRFLIRSAKEKYLRIKLEDGRIINVSRGHPLLKMTKNGMEKVKAEQICIGDYLPALKSLSINKGFKNVLNLESAFKSLGFQLRSKEGNPYFFRLNKNKVYLPKIIKIDFNLARILGYYAAEGYSLKTNKSPRVVFSFGKHELSLVNELKLLIKKVFRVEPLIYVHSASIKLYLYGKIFSILFEDIFKTGDTAYTKKVPYIIYNSDQSTISNYLDSYFLGDGIFVQNNADTLCLDVFTQSAGKDLVSGLHYLLLMLSINVSLSFNKNREVYYLRIRGRRNISEFIKFCGSGMKLRELKHLAASIYKPLSEKYPYFYFNLEKAPNWEERQIIESSAIRNGEIGAQLSLLCHSDELFKIKNSLIHPTKIVSIEEIDYDGNFYNIELNENHIFLHGNGVFTHNCEEWWIQELEKEAKIEDIKEKTKLEEPFLRELFSNPIKTKLSAYHSINISKCFSIPLHPRYTYHWKDISIKEMLALFSWLNRASIEKNPYKIILPLHYEVEGIKLKRVLELLGVPHQVASNENVVILDDWAEAFMVSLGFYENDLDLSSLIEKVGGNEDVLGFVNEISEVKIRDKSGFCIGARMGRPEKAKMRKLTGSPHVLFPVGDEGGRLRSFQSSLGMEKVTADFPLYYCDNCKRDLVYPKCGYCDRKTRLRFYCRDCDKVLDDKCAKHQSVPYNTREVDIEDYLNLAKQKLKIEELPPLIKGVRGTSNELHLPEHLVKGVLRAMYDLYVNKDGTIRYDMTEMPITHFKAKEIGVSVERLKQLGYKKDIYGKELENDDQLLEIKPQDVILPRCVGSKEEGADIVFFRVANYLDALLKEHYGLQSFYKLKSKQDLVGHLVVGLAPHTSSGIIGRIIGFSDTQGCYAHPMWHAAMRRDCEGDETSCMLLLDLLVNFSRKYLPAHRGSTQDACLVLTSKIIPSEVDEMVLDLDVVWKYPLEFYEAAMKFKGPWEFEIERLGKRLGTEKQYSDFGFTHEVSNLNQGVLCSAYKSLPTMREKVFGQMDLAQKIRAVNEADVARLVIERHFIRDIRGNLRKFSVQQFRCVDCNEKFRRPPLIGKCTRCGGKIIFTISQGSIMKYLTPSLELAKRYDLPNYLKQTLEITKKRIDSVFGKEDEQQQELASWLK